MFRLSVLLICLLFSGIREPLEIDFGLEKNGANWSVTNDTVMGGRLDDWEVITIKMSDFKLYRMSRSNGQKLTEEDAAKLIRIGFIFDDKREIAFAMEVDYIKF